MEELGLSSAAASEWLDDEEEECDSFPVYPENLLALRVFIAMGTQWRAVGGMQGLIYTGLDYNVLPEMWERFDVPKKERTELFNDLRIMEVAALPIRNAPTPA